MEIREINYFTNEYTQELDLRDVVLRKPLEMSLYDANLDAEKYDVHIGAFENKRLVGVLILTRLNDVEIKMRQVAVAENMQDQKVGTKMVMYAEAYAKNKGYSTMVLNARKAAVGFYEKLGYSTISDEFLEINIPHYKMQKRISE